MENEVIGSLRQLSEEARELYLSNDIPVLHAAPTPLVFLREYVAKNRPVIIKNALGEWPALSKWNSKYLEDNLGSMLVSVTVTPNGYADAPVGDRFLLPEERVMPFNRFLDIWTGKEKPNGVFYIQKQNSNFTDEFSKLIADADDHISWASEAFGMNPDAVNFWMGNSDAITSMHKDHYENLYAVIKGRKSFILHPPTDIASIPYETFKLARYKEDSGGEFQIFDVYKEGDSLREDLGDNFLPEESEAEAMEPKSYDDRENELVSWISVDPLRPDLEKYPQYANCQPYVAEVYPGDLLYLPSLWFHHVMQSDQTIAVNFWYDMEYDVKYNYFKFAEAVSKAVQK